MAKTLTSHLCDTIYRTGKQLNSWPLSIQVQTQVLARRHTDSASRPPAPPTKSSVKYPRYLTSMDPSSRIRDWAPSVLNLRGLCSVLLKAFNVTIRKLLVIPIYRDIFRHLDPTLIQSTSSIASLRHLSNRSLAEVETIVDLRPVNTSVVWLEPTVDDGHHGGARSFYHSTHFFLLVRFHLRSDSHGRFDVLHWCIVIYL